MIQKRRIMRLKCLACDVLARPLYLNAAHSPHIVDIELFPRGLHNTPAVLRSTLQDHIDAAVGQGTAGRGQVGD